jgi:hypothetical protein
MEPQPEQLQITNSNGAPPDRIERVPFGERWMLDVWETFHVPAGFGLTLTDMTQVKTALRILRDAKIPATLPHLIVRAVGIAFARAKDVSVLCNYRRIYPSAVNVGLSMAGETTYAPVVVIPAVDRKPLSSLIPAIIQEVDAAAAREAGDLRTIYKFAIPFRWLRLLILRALNRSMKWRLRIVGHVQVTCLNNTDVAVPLVFYSNTILGVGAVRDRVVAVGGVPMVRPTVWLSGVGDHAAADGLRGGDTLQVLKEILEGDDLVREARDAAALRAAQAKDQGEASRLLGEPRSISSSHEEPA